MAYQPGDEGRRSVGAEQSHGADGPTPGQSPGIAEIGATLVAPARFAVGLAVALGPATSARSRRGRNRNSRE